MDKSVYLCVHGHFYQPPRENPWLEEIEAQPSAAPFHDWNERISHECYLPNSLARILDDKGMIVDIVNNYRLMSFNFGPTLLAWIEKNHREAYERIMDADEKSVREHAGHGNAIAQVYNHMIMPLASARDKVTQVRWGLAEFHARFGRKSESIWLPETAVDERSLEVLIEEGIRYIILAPRQAAAVRPLARQIEGGLSGGPPAGQAGDWKDVSDGSIDPKMPYRWNAKTSAGKFLDIFFYDGPISNDLGFGDLAYEAKRFADRIEKAKTESQDQPQLIHAAVDGETFGHHKVFADRALAFLLHREAKLRHLKVTNYGEFLDIAPPTFEVKLSGGEEGLGTSWSCAHGVRRWKEHCGCRAGGPNEWNQHWRKPLRETLDWLRDELAKIYESAGSQYLKDVWDARNDYIKIILDRSEKSHYLFFEKNAFRKLDHGEVVICLKLLESQRHAQLMYASCGWFFNDISGIETVQILQHAARAIELAEEVSGTGLEDNLLNRLEAAKSNLREFRTGRGVYEKRVQPSRAGLRTLAASFAVRSAFEKQAEEAKAQRIYIFDVLPHYGWKESSANGKLQLGHLKISSLLTLEERELVFASLELGPSDLRIFTTPFESREKLQIMEREIFSALTGGPEKALKKIKEHFGPHLITLKDLPLRERLLVLQAFTKQVIEKMSEVNERLYEANRGMNEIYHSANLPVPEEIRDAVRYTLARRLKEAVAELVRGGFEISARGGSPPKADQPLAGAGISGAKKAKEIYHILQEAKSFDVELKLAEVESFLTLELEKRIHKFSKDHDRNEVIGCLHLMKAAAKIRARLDLRSAQDEMFSLLRSWTRANAKLPQFLAEDADSLLELLESLGLSSEGLKKQMPHPHAAK